ncbi:MAG: alpha/beta hydrolase [Dehalococcoidia bacterium]
MCGWLSRWLLGSLLLAGLLAACSRNEPTAGDVATPPVPSPEPALVASITPTSTSTAAAPNRHSPRLETVDCAAFQIDGSQPDVPVRCGYLVVAENRDRPDGATIKIAVAIFSASDAVPNEPPLIWLDGGPGGDTIEQIASVIAGPAGRLILPGGRGLVAERDLILVDQRGTGLSQPSLACPELEAFKQPGRDPATSAAGADQAGITATLVCRDRLAAEGVDLSAYTSRENAADINDLRAVLGLKQVNLYGVSYGTRLALTVMRDFPGTVRSAVLDSPLPLQADLYTGAFTGAQRSLDLIFDGCAADQICGSAYPRLQQTFYDLINRLNADPIPFTNRDPTTGDTTPAVLSGDELAGAIFDLLYVTPMLPLIPAIIDSVAHGEVDTFLLLLRQINASGGVNQAMYYSVQCSDELPFVSASDQEAAAKAVHPALAQALGPSFGREIQTICASWPSHPSATIENEPVASDVPTLILSGRHDPITPPTFAEIAATTLPNSTVVIFPGVGHGALLSTHTCPYDITWTFLRDPSARPDTACVAEMKEPAWVVRR